MADTQGTGKEIKIVALVGSLRRASVNRELTRIAAENTADGVTLEYYAGLEKLPFYNEDLDIEPADTEVARVRTAVADADAVLIVTPEYNGTIPAVLKNAIDWLSRPYGSGALTAKPVGVISAAPTAYGAKWSHEHTAKAVEIAGGRIVEDVTLNLSIQVPTLADDAELVAQLRTAVAALVESATPVSA
jgi:NAD(P)H-dependent FMN reductase